MVRPDSHSLFHSAYRTFIGLLDLGFSWVEIGSITPEAQVRRMLFGKVM